jgi:hypothetical protein
VHERDRAVDAAAGQRRQRAVGHRRDLRAHDRRGALHDLHRQSERRHELQQQLVLAAVQALARRAALGVARRDEDRALAVPLAGVELEVAVVVRGRLRELAVHGEPRDRGAHRRPLAVADQRAARDGLDGVELDRELAVGRARLVLPGVDAIGHVAGRADLDPEAARRRRRELEAAGRVDRRDLRVDRDVVGQLAAVAGHLRGDVHVQPHLAARERLLGVGIDERAAHRRARVDLELQVALGRQHVVGERDVVARRVAAHERDELGHGTDLEAAVLGGARELAAVGREGQHPALGERRLRGGVVQRAGEHEALAHDDGQVVAGDDRPDVGARPGRAAGEELVGHARGAREREAALGVRARRVDELVGRRGIVERRNAALPGVAVAHEEHRLAGHRVLGRVDEAAVHRAERRVLVGQRRPGAARRRQAARAVGARLRERAGLPIALCERQHGRRRLLSIRREATQARHRVVITVPQPECDDRDECDRDQQQQEERA